MYCREFLQRKDIGYVASFEPRYADIAQAHMDRINFGYSPRPFFKILDKIWDDHRNQEFEVIKLAKSGNKLVNEGLIALAEMQAGKRTKTFDYYVIGESNQGVSIRDDHLYDECARIRIPDAGGTFIQRQSTVFYSVFFPKTIPSCEVSETAIVDADKQATDKMLLRTVLPEVDNIPHKKDFDTVFVAHVIFSGSV